MMRVWLYSHVCLWIPVCRCGYRHTKGPIDTPIEAHLEITPRHIQIHPEKQKHTGTYRYTEAKKQKGRHTEMHIDMHNDTHTDMQTYTLTYNQHTRVM